MALRSLRKIVLGCSRNTHTSQKDRGKIYNCKFLGFFFSKCSEKGRSGAYQ